MLGNPLDISIDGILQPLDNSLPSDELVYIKLYLPGFRSINEPLQVGLEGLCTFSAVDTSVCNAITLKESDVPENSLAYDIDTQQEPE